jgi:hypothetical protein
MKVLTLAIACTLIVSNIFANTAAQAAPKAGNSIQVILTPVQTSNPEVVIIKSMGQYIAYDSNGNWFKTQMEKGKLIAYTGNNLVLQWKASETIYTAVAQTLFKRNVTTIGSKMVFGPKVSFKSNVRIDLCSDFTREVAATRLKNLGNLTLPLVIKGQANVFDTADFKVMYNKFLSIK